MELFPESFYENNFGTVSITHENTLDLLKNNYQLPEKNLLSSISENKKLETLID